MELPIRHRLPRAVPVLVLALAAVPWLWANPGSEPAPATRVQLTMFMPNRGVAHPVGCDPSDNWAINIVEKYANVDLLLDIPNWSDYTTKVNLLLASANLPDIVNGNVSAEFLAAAEAGVAIAADDAVTDLGEATASHQADVAGSDDTDSHVAS